MQLTEKDTTAHQILSAGRWLTEQAYADHTSITRQTLANWRYRDKLAGRSAAAPGYPVYRRFGRAIRYWVGGGAAA